MSPATASQRTYRLRCISIPSWSTAFCFCSWRSPHDLPPPFAHGRTSWTSWREETTPESSTRPQPRPRSWMLTARTTIRSSRCGNTLFSGATLGVDARHHAALALTAITVFLGVSPHHHHLFGREAFARGFPPGVDEKKIDPPGSRGFPPGVDRF